MHASTGQQQYATGVPAQHMTGMTTFSSNLCECHKNVPICFLTCFCPCITFGRIAEIVDRGSTSCGLHGALYVILCLGGCQCLYSFSYRSKLREQFALYGQSCNDCVVHCFCEWCALCQEYRELKHRGLEPAYGWEGNMAMMQNQGVQMPPVGPTGMKR